MTKLIQSLGFYFIMMPSLAVSAVVETFQMPAWINLDGEKKAMRIGMQIQQQTAVETGDGGKVYIEMEEGSRLKVGPKSAVKVLTLKTKEQTSNNIFKSVINIVRGAFRFTTNARYKSRKRDITFKVRAITAGIRGTDIWGKSVPEKDFICLLEGAIKIKKNGEAEQEMNHPATFFVVKRNQPSSPIKPVAPKLIKKWSKITDTLKGQGTIIKNGRYHLNLLSFKNPKYTKKWQNRLEQDGFATDIKQIELNGTTWHRLSINLIKSYQDALFLQQKVNQLYEFKSSWINR